MKKKFIKYLLVALGIICIFYFITEGHGDNLKVKRNNTGGNLSKETNVLNLKQKNKKDYNCRRIYRNVYFNLDDYRTNAKNLTVTVNDPNANKDPGNIENVEVTVYSNAINDLVVVLNESSANSGNFVGKINENYLKRLKLKEGGCYIQANYTYKDEDSQAISIVKTPALAVKDIASLEELARTIDTRLYNTGLIKKFYIIEENGGRLDWLQKGEIDLITFDKKGQDGYHDVWVMKPDGSEKKCLTCDKPETLLPQKHNGNPVWHLSGRYIIFEAEEPGHPAYLPARDYFRDYLGVDDLGEFQYLADSFASQPGWGYYCNLWAMTPDGENFWKLTDIPYTTEDPMGAVLHPQFSLDGTQLIWAHRLGEGSPWGGDWGDWGIKIADFDDSSGEPKLKNEQLYTQLGAQRYSFYETHGFAPHKLKSLIDDKPVSRKTIIDEEKIKEQSIIIFSGNLGIGHEGEVRRHEEYYLDLYTWDLNSPEEPPQPLTKSFDEWEEHGHFSPSGEKIIYMSSEALIEGVAFPADWWTVLKADYWIMKKDGSEKTKLTYFNKPEQEVVDKATEKRYTCADSSWNKDGTKLAVLVGRATGETMEDSFIAIMEFKERQ